MSLVVRHTGHTVHTGHTGIANPQEDMYLLLYYTVFFVEVTTPECLPFPTWLRGYTICFTMILLKHLWGVALERNFGKQFSAATLGSSFPQLWGNSFGEQLWAQLSGAAQRRGTALGSTYLQGISGSNFQ